MKLKNSPLDQQEIDQLNNQSTPELIETLQQYAGEPRRKELGWAVSKIFGQMAVKV